MCDFFSHYSPVKEQPVATFTHNPSNTKRAVMLAVFFIDIEFMDKILFPFVFVWPVLVHCSPVKWFFIIVQRKLTKNYYVQCVYMYYCHLMFNNKKVSYKIEVLL